MISPILYAAPSLLSSLALLPAPAPVHPPHAPARRAALSLREREPIPFDDFLTGVGKFGAARPGRHRPRRHLQQRPIGLAEPRARETDPGARANTADDLITLTRSAPVVVFLREISPASNRAVRLLRLAGAEPKLIDLDPKSALCKEIARITGRTSVPCIWIGGEFVGGCDDGPTPAAPGIVDLAFAGALRERLDAAGVPPAPPEVAPHEPGVNDEAQCAEDPLVPTREAELKQETEEPRRPSIAPSALGTGVPDFPEATAEAGAPMVVDAEPEGVAVYKAAAEQVARAEAEAEAARLVAAAAAETAVFKAESAKARQAAEARALAARAEAETRAAAARARTAPAGPVSMGSTRKPASLGHAEDRQERRRLQALRTEGHRVVQAREKMQQAYVEKILAVAEAKAAEAAAKVEALRSEGLRSVEARAERQKASKAWAATAPEPDAAPTSAAAPGNVVSWYDSGQRLAERGSAPPPPKRPLRGKRLAFERLTSKTKGRGYKIPKGTRASGFRKGAAP